jgi:DNA polymerase
MVLELLRQTKKILLLQDSMGIEGYDLPPGGGFIRSGSPSAQPAASQPAPRTGQTSVPGSPPKSPPGPTLAELRQELEKCTRCRLCTSRNCLVFGSGAPDARLLILGEWPEGEDDATGEPFSGEAGVLLEKMLSAIGLKRHEVYTAYVVKCLTPEGEPDPDTIKACLPFLTRQIEALGPEIICAMGPLTTQALLKTRKSLLQLRGRFHDFHGILLMPTFSPNFLSRHPEMKKAAWHDLQMIEKRYNQGK